MPSIDPDRAYPDEAAYWRLLEATMVKVFDIHPSDARARVDARLRALADAPPDQRLLSFHAEPLSIAAALLGCTIPPDGLAEYLGLAADLGWQHRRDLPSQEFAAA